MRPFRGRLQNKFAEQGVRPGEPRPGKRAEIVLVEALVHETCCWVRTVRTVVRAPKQRFYVWRGTNKTTATTTPTTPTTTATTGQIAAAAINADNQTNTTNNNTFCCCYYDHSNPSTHAPVPAEDAFSVVRQCAISASSVLVSACMMIAIGQIEFAPWWGPPTPDAAVPLNHLSRCL